jgi:1-acyl-sn-glycerol-3-phosphate acyltransferase
MHTITSWRRLRHRLGEATGPADQERLVDELDRLTREEMRVALSTPDPHSLRGRLLTALLGPPSRRLARVLARLDAEVAAVGLARAAAGTLERFGVEVVLEGLEQVPDRSVLFVSNHPGLYDSLVLFASTSATRSLRVIAAERPVLQAMPALSRHLLFVRASQVSAQLGPLRQGLRHLQQGGSLLHYPAGRIEPDPALAAAGQPLLCDWSDSAGALALLAARGGGGAGSAAVAGTAWVVPVLVSGVSAPHFRSGLLGKAGALGMLGGAQLAPLLQLAVPGLSATRVVARFGQPLEVGELARGRPPGRPGAVQVTAVLREALARLARGR